MIKIKTAALADTADALFQGEKGVLVLDRYAEAAARTRPGRVDMDNFITMALTAPALDEVVSMVLLTIDGFLASSQVRGTFGYSRNIHTGVCLDGASASDETLDQLRESGASAVELRANLGPTVAEPGKPAIEASVLARRARAAQDAGLLPILTFAMPDLVSQSSNVTYAVTANALRGLVTACEAFGVEPSEMIIRTSMVTPGSLVSPQPSAAEVGAGTVAAIREHVPSSIGGVLLLSSGTDLATSCANLSGVALAASGAGVDWPVSFGFARPLIESAVRLWDGTSGSPVARMAVTSACRSAANALAAGRAA